jgi:hypothetical protein
MLLLAARCLEVGSESPDHRSDAFAGSLVKPSWHFTFQLQLPECAVQVQVRWHLFHWHPEPPSLSLRI